MRIYLDNCCFNRPFDDQSQRRIQRESEAKLWVQESIRSGRFGLVWSYILDYENSRNPFEERRRQIAAWRARALIDVVESEEVLVFAKELEGIGFKGLDALHVSCAVSGNARHFLTTDDTILKKADQVDRITISDPIQFAEEVQP